MHPAYARVWRIVPEERGGFSSDSVRIEYVEPALPMPDSARVAAAARAALEYEASITSVTRYLAGAERWGQPLWIAVGDTADVGVEEMTCHYDACRVSNWPQLPGTWRVTDTTVATLLAPRIMPNVPNFFPGKRRVVGASPGTTTLEVAGLPGTATPTRTPPPSRVDRVVVVTPPLTGIRIAPRLTTIDSTRAVTLAITAIDRDGAVHEDAPGTIVVIYRGDTTRYGDSKITSWFSAPGAVTVIARFRALTDTLRFTVVRPPSP
jgi:hypothetical protein